MTATLFSNNMIFEFFGKELIVKAGSSAPRYHERAAVSHRG
jgi:hypothetical protein